MTSSPLKEEGSWEHLTSGKQHSQNQCPVYSTHTGVRTNPCERLPLRGLRDKPSLSVCPVPGTALCVWRTWSTVVFLSPLNGRSRCAHFTAKEHRVSHCDGARTEDLKPKSDFLQSHIVSMTVATPFLREHCAELDRSWMTGLDRSV